MLTFRELLADTQHSPWLSMATVKSLEEANNLATQLTNLPVVDKVISIADFIPDQQDEKLQIIEGIALTLDLPSLLKTMSRMIILSPVISPRLTKRLKI